MLFAAGSMSGLGEQGAFLLVDSLHRVPNLKTLDIRSAGTAEHLKIRKYVLRACSDFDLTLRGAPFPHPTPQGRWVQFPETRLQG